MYLLQNEMPNVSFNFPENVQIQVTYTFDIIKDKNGKDLIDLKTQKFAYDVKDNAHFYLGNLFNGNKELGK